MATANDRKMKAQVDGSMKGKPMVTNTGFRGFALSAYTGIFALTVFGCIAGGGAPDHLCH